MGDGDAKPSHGAQAQAQAQARRGGGSESLREWAARADPKAAEAGFDVGDLRGTLRRYVDKDKGRVMREMHRGYARQYQKVYGYTIATFLVAGGIAWVAGAFAKSESPAAESERRRSG